MSKTIVIVGVTGVQGSSVAEIFLQLEGWKVRGITRNPSSPAAQTLATNGVEIVQGDLDDKASLLRAFEGAHVVHSNTDFFAHLFYALVANDEVLKGRTARQYAYDREVEQGVNISEAAATPSVLGTLERFIFSSLSDARKWSKGKYSTVYHNQTKAEIIRVTHERFPELAAKMSTVQIGQYVTNWKIMPPLAPQKQSDGSYLFRRMWSAEHKVPYVVAHKDTGKFVQALVDLPAGTNLAGTSEMMTVPAFAKLWGEVRGVSTSFEGGLSMDEFFEGLPDVVKGELGETFEYVAEFGDTGGDPDVLTAEQLGIKIPVTSMREYIENEDWSSVL